MTVAVQTAHPGRKIAPTAAGLSFETSLMSPNASGVRYFRPDNTALINVFRTLGIKSLRIGGNSVDAPELPVPSADDVASFFEFARAAGVKVIYSVRLQDGSAESAANIAKIIHDRFSDVLESFAIGNEPDYYKDYQLYCSKWIPIRDAIVAVYPEARFSGPDRNPSPEHNKMLVRDFGGASGRLAQITQHSYPFGCSYKNPEVARKDVNLMVKVDEVAARARMLAPTAYPIYEKIRDGCTQAVAGTSITWRMTEVNSFWFSGLEGASDRYSAALWGLDYLHWWVLNGSEGLNFHTGDRTGGAINMPCRYAAFVSAPGGYEVRPLGYAIKMFDVASRGRVIAAKIAGEASDVAAYTTLADDQTAYVTIINKAFGPDANERTVQIDLDVPLASSSAQAMWLRGKNNDIAGTSSDVTVGNAPINPQGQWNGAWSMLAISSASPKSFAFAISPASAVVVKVKLK